MTIIEHIYAVKNLAAGGSPTDDFPYSDSFIYHLLKVNRATLLAQKLNRYSFVSPNNMQSICIDLELSTYNNCCDNDGCKTLKSTIELPTLVISRNGIQSMVTDFDGNVISKKSITNKKFEKYGLNKPQKFGYFIKDNYLYVEGPPTLKKVIFSGIFATPEKLYSDNCADGLCKDPHQSEFPIDADLVDAMYKMTLQELTTPFLKDTKNDAEA